MMVIHTQRQEWGDYDRYLFATDSAYGSIQLDVSDIPDANTNADAYVYALWVNKEQRKKGIATALLKRAEEKAKQCGCKRIALYWDRRESERYVLNWYKRQGYREHGFNEYQVFLVKDL